MREGVARPLPCCLIFPPTLLDLPTHNTSIHENNSLEVLPTKQNETTIEHQQPTEYIQTMRFTSTSAKCKSQKVPFVLTVKVHGPVTGAIITDMLPIIDIV